MGVEVPEEPAVGAGAVLVHGPQVGRAPQDPSHLTPAVQGISCGRSVTLLLGRRCCLDNTLTGTRLLQGQVLALIQDCYWNKTVTRKETATGIRQTAMETSFRHLASVLLDETIRGQILLHLGSYIVTGGPIRSAVTINSYFVSVTIDRYFVTVYIGQLPLNILSRWIVSWGKKC